MQRLKLLVGSIYFSRPYCGTEVDVWSAGVILFALLTGSLPFDEDSTPNLFAMIRAAVFRIPNYLSGSSANLIKRMLTANPLSRITIAEIHEHPWYKHQLPMYLSVIDNTLPAEANIKLDDKILSMTFNIINHMKMSGESQEEIKKNIMSREILPHYNVIYEILYDMEESAMRTKMVERKGVSKIFSNENVNKYKNDCKASPCEKWKFGICMKPKDPAEIMKSVFDVLKQMKFVTG